MHEKMSHGLWSEGVVRDLGGGLHRPGNRVKSDEKNKMNGIYSVIFASDTKF